MRNVILSIRVFFIMRAYANELPIPAQPSRLHSIYSRESQGYHGGNRGRNRGNGQRFNCGTDGDPRSLTITTQIKAASTIVELLSTHRAHESRLDHIHLSACWTSLAQQARQRLAEQCWLERDAEALGPLVQHTVRAAMEGKFDARGFANLA